MDAVLFLGSLAYVVFLGKSNKPGLRSPSKPLSSTSLRSALQDGTSLDAHERVCTVSVDNVPTPSGNVRSEMRLQNLWHRATYVLVHVEHSTTQKGDDSVVLIQKRSALKDYFPSCWDPTPGGVVGFGESYDENATRELEEELGIPVVVIKTGEATSNSCFMERIFTFPYEDDKVKVWGSFYEATFCGKLSDLKLQEEEVETVFTLPLTELQKKMEKEPSLFLPDSAHALRLYLQRRTDVRVNRKLLKGYSSSDLDQYTIRPKPKVIFFDCDDTLYTDNWTTAARITANIRKLCVEQLGLPPDKSYALYKEYGTALSGLLAEGYIENTDEAIDKYLTQVHDLPIHELIPPDPKLREMLLRLDPSIPKYIFTASVSDHARRCIKALGIEDLFHPTIIDVKECSLATKHSASSFQAAMKVAGINDPEACLFLDDSVKNIQAARSIGWRSVLVGRVSRDSGKSISSPDAEIEIDSIHDVAEFLPELMAPPSD